MSSLTVERPLQVSHPLEDIDAKENSSVKLSCGFDPSPRVVRWFKGRTALKTSDKYSMTREGHRAELTIHGLTGVDSGQYRCVAGGSQSTAHVEVEGRTSGARGDVLSFSLAKEINYFLLFHSANTEAG